MGWERLLGRLRLGLARRLGRLARLVTPTRTTRDPAPKHPLEKPSGCIDYTAPGLTGEPYAERCSRQECINKTSAK
ncbi:hypothetical protein NITHO_310002 [Nitrolancea hollandica Lb]|uniref:Uncharacterized protein n=1 Tax=Nitrolancea hollandica Lb TaxID=1129897 RepID=I4EHE7_9BACT|nr:hypothetical protein NITHO_310002 [Nitrolancea hollandica Lb]